MIEWFLVNPLFLVSVLNGTGVLPKKRSTWHESLAPENGLADSRMKKRNKRHNLELIVKKLRDAEVMLNNGKIHRPIRNDLRGAKRYQKLRGA